MITQNIVENSILLGINPGNQNPNYSENGYDISQHTKIINVITATKPNEVVLVIGSTNAADFDVWKFVTIEKEVHPMYLSEPSLSEYWDTPEEDEAWLHL